MVKQNDFIAINLDSGRELKINAHTRKAALRFLEYHGIADLYKLKEEN